MSQRRLRSRARFRPREGPVPGRAEHRDVSHRKGEGEGELILSGRAQ